jgi:hypothetical protein
MLKPKFSNILLFLFVKYIVFFLALAFMGGRFKLLVINNSGNRQELFSNTGYYLSYIMIFTMLGILIFSAPIYFILKVKNAIYFVLLISGVLVGEYLLYTSLASTSNLMNGVYNGIISILFLLIFFYRHIVLIFSRQEN